LKRLSARALVWQALRADAASGIFARMRFLASCAAVLMLTACATAAPSAPSTPSAAQPAATAPSSSRHAQLLRSAGSASAPTRTEVERTFGRADIVREDGAGAALTYRLETCALLLLFSSGDSNSMRLTEAHLSARSGGAAPSLDQCAAEAARRS
jgi:hypothetical protein